MNTDKHGYEKQLEAAIDRELKAIPPLTAPATLILRVLTEIENRVRLPWYRQSWPMWPVALRAVSFLILLGAFAALCFAGWEASQTQRVLAAMHTIGGWFSGVTTVWNTLNALAGAGVAVAKHLGNGFIIGCLAAAALGYGLCLSLGTFYVRLAFGQR